VFRDNVRNLRADAQDTCIRNLRRRWR